MSTKHNLEDLENLIKEAKIAYYNGNPIISDEEYDLLEDELKLRKPDSSVLKLIEPTTTGFKKVKHSIPMGSLSKVKNETQWYQWVEKFPKNTSFAITEKFDGISICLKYENGVFKQALTRGRDGTEGEDITINVKRMKNVILQLPNINFTGWLRGEILLLKSDQKYFPDSKSLRNTAVGTAKRLDSVGCEYLTVQYYEVFDSNKSFYSLTEQFNFLDRNKITTTMCMSTINKDEIPFLIKAWDSNREDMDYEIDGLVIRINAQNKFEAMGEVDNRPKGAIAYKFPPQTKQTTIKSIDWQVGKTGRVTPVANLIPVNIGGVTISRASLHTAKIAFESKAGPGAEIILSRANDVIPYISKVLKPVEVPLPEFQCDWDGEYLVIREMDDKTELYNSIKTWVQRLRILHWGDALIKIIIDYELASSLPNIYNLDWNILGDLVGHGIAKRAKKSLEDKGQNISFADFMSALNIRYLDTRAKNLVAIGINTPEKLLISNITQLTNAEGIGNTKAVEILKSIEKLRPVIEQMGKIIHFKEKSGSLTGISFVFTGALSRPRKEFENMVLDNGGEVKKSVSKDTTYLVMANPDSTTTKAQKARKLGTKCISEIEFRKMCEN